MKKRPNILWLCADQQRYDPAYTEIRFNMLKKSFDVSAVVQRPGQTRIGRY